MFKKFFFTIFRMNYSSNNGSSNSASPGPLKKFRKMYASEVRTDSSTVSKMPGNHFTHDWVQNYHCQSYPSQSFSNVFFFFF